MIMHVVLVSAMAAIAASQLCPPPVIPIDVEKFSGIWYSQHRFEGDYFVTPGCFRIDVTAHKHDEGFSLDFDYRKNQLLSMPLRFDAISGSDRYTFTFGGTSYLVSFLAVKYDSYAVFYDCSSSEVFSYVMTRSKERNDTLIDIAIRDAKQVWPLLPPSAKTLNCEIF